MKEFNWTSEIKHSKVLQMVEGIIGITDEGTYNIIKAVVLEVNNLNASRNILKYFCNSIKTILGILA